MSDIRAALSRALEAATGRRAHGSTIDVLAAQVSLETAHGEQMFNYNFGGIKGHSPAGTTATYMTREVVDGRSVPMAQGFRAYATLDEGARDYVAVLQSRFPQAFSRAVSGDVDGFAHALKQSHYYTAPEEQYAAGLRAAAGLPSAPSPSRVDGLSAGVDPTAPVQPVPSGFSTTGELSRVLDAISASTARIAAPDPTD